MWFWGTHKVIPWSSPTSHFTDGNTEAQVTKLWVAKSGLQDQNSYFFLNLSASFSFFLSSLPLSSPPCLLYFDNIDFFLAPHTVQQFPEQFCSTWLQNLDVLFAFKWCSSSFSPPFKVIILSKIGNKERWFETWQWVAITFICQWKVKHGKRAARRSGSEWEVVLFIWSHRRTLIYSSDKTSRGWLVLGIQQHLRQSPLFVLSQLMSQDHGLQNETGWWPSE